MIGEWELDTKYYHIAIINLSRRVWRLDETYACFTSTHLFIFPKCPPNIFRFSSSLYDQCRMSILIIMHTCGPYYYLLCYTLWTIIEHPYIEYLISLHKLFCILLLLWRMNHLTLCSSSNHLWYPLLVLYWKAHVSFITFILEDEYWLSLGILMHVKCIHELCTISLIFQSYLHHIRVIPLLFNDFRK